MEKASIESMLDTALRYVTQHRFSVIPAGDDGNPLVDWRDFQQRLPTAKEVTDWWTVCPDANIVFVTGPVSRIAVISIVTEEGYGAMADILPIDLCTPTVKTPSGGQQLYFRSDDPNLRSNIGVIPGCDLDAQGGYVVAPPTSTCEGSYGWVNGRELGKCVLAQIPSSYMDVLIDNKEYVPTEKTMQINDHNSLQAITVDHKDLLSEGEMLAKICELKYNPSIPRGYKIRIEDNKGYLSSVRKSKNGRLEISEIGPVVAIVNTIVTEETNYITVVGDTKHCQITNMAISADGGEFETSLNNTFEVVLDRERIKLYRKYLSDYNILNKPVIPKITGLTRTGWYGDKYLLPSIEHDGYIWTDSRLADSFTSAGEDIVESGRLLKILNTPAGVAILAMLSATLVHKVNIENFVVNVTGHTKEGKSTSARVGASLFGNPTKLMGTWFATKVGAELQAATHRDNFTWIDELETAGKNLSAAVDFLYQYTAGEGKTRGNKGLSLRKTLLFRGVLITTSEKNLDSIIAQVKDMRTQPMGLHRRVLEIKATDTYYKPFSGDVVTDLPELNQFCNTNYGHFGAKWISYVTANITKIVADYKNVYKVLASEISCAGLESAYAVIITVLHCLQDMCVIDQTICANAQEHITLLANANAERLNEVLSFNDNFLKKLADFCMTNLKKFTPDEEKVDSLYGKIMNGTDVFIITAGLAKLCKEEGLIMEQVLDELQKHNRLKCTFEKGKNSKLKTRRQRKESLLRNKVWGYRILNVLESEVKTDYEE